MEFIHMLIVAAAEIIVCLVILIFCLASTVYICMQLIQLQCRKVKNIMIMHHSCTGWQSCCLLLMWVCFMWHCLLDSWMCETLSQHIVFGGWHLYTKLFVHAVHTNGNISCVILIITWLYVEHQLPQWIFAINVFCEILCCASSSERSKNW